MISDFRFTNSKFKIQNSKFQPAGFGLVEILIASAIIAVALVTSVAVIESAFRITGKDVRKIQAEFLASEGIEAVRTLRDTSWETNLLSVAGGTAYYPVFNTTISNWSLATVDPGSIDGVFTRAILFGDVYRRNNDDDIVDISSPDPKTLDTGTKKVVSRTSWTQDGETTNVQLETYLTDLFDN